MSKFKVGDMVVRTKARNATWLEYEAENGPGPYLVNDVCGMHIIICDLNGSKSTFIADNFSTAITPRIPADPVIPDAVNSPKHYQFFPDLEAIEIIARSMTREQFYGYCLGNRLKYRLRAGNKDKLEQDIAKSDKYLELYEKHKGLCSDAK